MKFLKLRLLFLLLSLVCVRLCIMTTLQIDLKFSIELGLFVGIFHDFLLIMICLSLSKLLFKKYSNLCFVFFSLIVWLASVSSIMFFLFFRVPLTLDTLYYQAFDVTSVGNNIAFFLIKKYMLLSLLFFTVFLVFSFLRKKKLDYQHSKIYYFLAFLMFFSLHKAPQLTNRYNILTERTFGRLDTAFSQTAIFEWIHEAWNSSRFKKKTTYYDPKNEKTYKEIILKFSKHKEWPYNFKPDQNLSLQLRDDFGFSKNQKVSVIYLYVESFRSYEFDHPIIGPLLYPELKKITSKRATIFTHVYSSVFESGQTSRGIWSTECSFFPNMGGISPLILNPLIKQKCFPDVLKESNYSTYAFFPAAKGFHNNSTFSLTHGIQNYFGKEWYLKNGAHNDYEMGISDADVFNIAKNKISNLVAKSKNFPFFLRMLTYSTHHPPKHINEGFKYIENFSKLPTDSDTLKQWTQLSYSDKEISHFINELFNMPGSENLLLVLMGDHSTSLQPHLFENEKKTEIKNDEYLFRIPLAFISKFSNSKTIQTPIHQLDISPTVMQILGYNTNKLTWLGRNFFLDKSGSDFIAGDTRLKSWNTMKNGRCLRTEEIGGSHFSCVENNEVNLLYNNDELSKTTAIEPKNFDDMLKLQRILIENNKISLEE